MKEFELTREIWKKEDIKEFQKYLISFSRDEEKRKWEKRVVSTNFPCLAVLSNDVKKIT